MRPSYTLEQLRAAALMKAEIYDFDVFVEDVSLTNLYRRLLCRAIGTGTIDVDPIALGGRENLLQFAADHIPKRKKPYLVIVDGDLLFVRGEEQTHPVDVYTLPAYSIENVLLEEGAIIEALRDMSGNMSRTEVCDAMKLQVFASQISRHLAPLFILYALVNQITPNIQTVDYNVARLTTGENLINIDPKSVKARYKELKSGLLEVLDKKTYRSKIKDISRNLKSSGHSPLHFVSGKSAIIPIIHQRAVTLCGFRGSRSQLLASIALHCEFAIAPELGQRLRALAA